MAIRGKKTLIIAAAAFIALSLLAIAGESEAAKKKTTPPAPPYKSSGPIPGTSLLYEGLFVSDNGRVTVTIYNPENTGLSFSANFGFYTSKDAFVTGFAISGFAARKGRMGYAMDLPNFKNFKKASYMKVLGRADRTGAN